MNPFASIWEDIPAPTVSKPKVQPKPKPKADHSEARAIYHASLKKVAFLHPHQVYAERVAKATHGPSMTPVYPLACMGTNNGPLLCDVCNKAIILESAPYYNVPADVAWKQNPLRSEKWMSYIKGGLVVDIVENGTLRIYHGYDGRKDDCCVKGKNEMKSAESKFVRNLPNLTQIHRFLVDEFPDGNHNEMLSILVNVMYSFDPGIGCNRPE